MHELCAYACDSHPPCCMHEDEVMLSSVVKMARIRLLQVVMPCLQRTGPSPCLLSQTCQRANFHAEALFNVQWFWPARATLVVRGFLGER
eukprot:366283-Chlamydomonas_euryale.AAC.7